MQMSRNKSERKECLSHHAHACLPAIRLLQVTNPVPNLKNGFGSIHLHVATLIKSTLDSVSLCVTVVLGMALLALK